MAEALTFFQSVSWKFRYFFLFSPAARLKYILNKNMRKSEWNHRGRFRSFQEAEAFLPPWRRSSFDNYDILSEGTETYSQIHIFDWPVLFYIQKIINEKTPIIVTDFGGHIGVKYYAFQQIVQFPDDLIWRIVDLPAMVAEGEKQKAPDNHALKFFLRLEDTEPCHLLICSGVLQYLDATLDEFFDRLPGKPEIIVLNKIGLSDRESCFGLDIHGQWSLPNRVFTNKELEEARLRLGYRLLRSWSIPHRNYILHDPTGKEEIQMIGEAWILNA